MMEALEAAKEHARAEAPKESCGFIAAGVYVACENKHRDPENYFRIDEPRFSQVVIDGSLQAVVHSHPRGPAVPSEFDQRQADALDVPSFIICGDRTMKGRKPDQIIAGNLDKVPPPPAWLSRLAKSEWRKVALILVERKHLTDADLGTLAAYADALGQLRS